MRRLASVGRPNSQGLVGAKQVCGDPSSGVRNARRRFAVRLRASYGHRVVGAFGSCGCWLDRRLAVAERRPPVSWWSMTFRATECSGGRGPAASAWPLVRTDRLRCQAGPRVCERNANRRFIGRSVHPGGLTVPDAFSGSVVESVKHSSVCDPPKIGLPE